MAEPGISEKATWVETSNSQSEGKRSRATSKVSIAEDDSSSHSSDSSSNGRVSEDSIGLAPLDHSISPALQEVIQIQTATSVGSSIARPAEFEVDFEDGENPREWSFWYRAWMTFAISYSTWIVVLYSTAYTSSIPGLMEEFGVSDQTIATLGVTTYLIGLGIGSLVWAPVSELYGRKPVYIVCMAIFTLLVLPTCLATSLTEIIVVRFFGAFFGAALIANSAGTVVDISTEETRALVLSLWSIAPLNGPVTGPVIGGFVYQYLGWQWNNWLILILAGAASLSMLGTAETYAPAILKAKAARKRKETNDDRWWTRYDLNLSPYDLVKLNLTRPFILFFTEPILWFFNLWISIVYGILYLCFVAYPLVFSQHRGWSPGLTGLSFVGIGLGTTIGIVGEPIWRRVINSHPVDPETGRRPPEATARILAIGSILTPIGQLVFAWTSLPPTHWAVSIAFGIPFGLGNSFSFIYGSNYLAGAYGIYAASALAGNAVTRSLLGGLLPLAGPKLYATLTPQWAGTFLGLLEVALIPIPFVFWRYGDKIRAKSPAIKELREDQERIERRAAKAQRRKDRAQQKSAVGVTSDPIKKEESV
ncbi:major facilitator superfamily domain-containing protein [Xylaria bambusicola]|uniref:major facilitator superfamily domain-containing protein n=1 Tax=Xylaria bambusicola TaxID=326684 RepID=UPI0020084544|nr:major facilitator superfamily domain-containing protein [Xylaria bambusicola]KAI0509488.1 major facilitator superfamily domain-containing protein [Xylaria bambusicola]